MGFESRKGEGVGSRGLGVFIGELEIVLGKEESLEVDGNLSGLCWGEGYV